MRKKRCATALLVLLMIILCGGCTAMRSPHYPLSQEDLEKRLSKLPTRYTVDASWLDQSFQAELDTPGFFALSSTEGIHCQISTPKDNRESGFSINMFIPAAPYETQADFLAAGMQPIFELARVLCATPKIIGKIALQATTDSQASTINLLANAEPGQAKPNISLRQRLKEQIWQYTIHYLANTDRRDNIYYVHFSLMPQTAYEENVRSLINRVYENDLKAAGSPLKTVAELLELWGVANKSTATYIVRGELTGLVEHHNDLYGGQIYYTGKLKDAGGEIAIRLEPTYLTQEELAAERDQAGSFDTDAPEPVLVIQDSLTVSPQ